jgi:hypothetical protein
MIRRCQKDIRLFSFDGGAADPQSAGGQVKPPLLGGRSGILLGDVGEPRIRQLALVH